MVSTDEKGMVCSDCGGRCPAGTENYDDVMHLEGCVHRAILDIWASHPELHVAARDSMLCVEFNKNVMEMTNAPFARSCPAHSMLFGVLSDLIELDSGIMCSHCEECYDKHYSKFEDEALMMAEEWASRTK